MQRDLKFNICELESSHLRNHEVPDLKLRIKSHIGPALQYACTHWIEHFTASPNQTLLTSTKTFFDGPQLMYWLEVLSILGRLDVAISGLSNLTALDLTQYDGWDPLAPWARDAHRFLLSFYDAIAASAPHLYISALAFAPSKSLTAQRMRPYFPNTIKVPAGDKNWYPCVKSILHPHQIQSLSASHDGLRLIAGYSDGSLCLWDNQTSVRIGELLIGHNEPVTCVVFSSDDSLVASSSCDTTIRVWEAKEYLKTHGTLSGHSSSVNCVAFSPNAAILASGSSDKTIRLWDPKALCSIGEPYVAHTSRVSSLAFSPDGTKLASASWDKTIRIWSVDLTGSKLSGNPLLITGHSDSVTCIAFFPDSSRIASGSVDRIVRIWDAQTGVQVETRAPLMKHSDSISAITFFIRWEIHCV
ncbi:unnamed protein product [Rhizoctonia solani]|uniref:Vegetative incompatibility protein HET-E-1 [Podospora anserina] n=1 Tax=Rhizoctonia solani TaxID=456999 RepID=A0A8H2WUG8_9AGAM|nr:unnamed protein product [Rhizoctonia solani]